MHQMRFTVLGPAREFVVGDEDATENCSLFFSNGNHYDLVLSHKRTRALAVAQVSAARREQYASAYTVHCSKLFMTLCETS